MAELHKVEGQVKLNCSADKAFEMMVDGQRLPTVCSDKVASVNTVRQGDCGSVGSTTEWVCVIDGTPMYFLAKIEALDKENRMIHRVFLDGDVMKTYYKSMASKMQFVPEGENCCLAKMTFEYEKLNEKAPEAHNLLEYALGLFRDLGSYLASA